MSIFQRIRDLLADQETPAVEPTLDQNAATSIHTELPEPSSAPVPETINVIATQVDQLPPPDASTMLVFAMPAPEIVAPAVRTNGYHPAGWDELLGADSSTGAAGDDDTIHLPGNWPEMEFVVQPTRKQRPEIVKGRGPLAKTPGSRRHKLLQARRKAIQEQAAADRARTEQKKKRKPRRMLLTERQFGELRNPQLFRAVTRARLTQRVSAKLAPAVRIPRLEAAVAKSRELTHDLTNSARRQSPKAKVPWVLRAKVVRFLQEQRRGEQTYAVCHHEPLLAESRTADGVGELQIFVQPDSWIRDEEGLIIERDQEATDRGNFIKCTHCNFVSYDGVNWVHPTDEVEVVRGRVHSERARRHFHLMSEEDIAALTNRPVGHCGQQVKCLNVTVNGHRWGSSMRKFELKRFGRPSLFRRNQQYGTLPRHRPQLDAEQRTHMLEPEDATLLTQWWFPELVQDEETGEWGVDPNCHYAFDRADFERVTYHSEYGFIPEPLWDYLDLELDELAAVDFDNITATCSFVATTFAHWARLPSELVEDARRLAILLFESGNMAMLMEVDRNAVASVVRAITPLPQDEMNHAVRLAAAKFIKSMQPARQAVRA